MIELPAFARLEEGEKVEMLLRRHPIAFLPVVFIGFSMLLIPIVSLAIFYPSISFTGELKNVLILGISAYLLFVIAYFITAFLDHYLDISIVTNRKIIEAEQEGLLSRNISQIPLSKIEDTTASKKGAFQTYFNYGTVFIQTAADIPNVHIYCIPDPYNVSRKIMELHQKSKVIQTEERAPTPLPPLTPEQDMILIKFNIARGQLAEVLNILPSLKSPTINDLADKNFVAVETVVKKSELNTLLPQLKEKGASDIIESEIKIL